MATLTESRKRELQRDLEAIVGPGAVLSDPDELLVYESDGLTLLRALAAPVQAASDDLATGLPRPKPWVLTTGRNSRFIKAVHVETPLDLAGALGFYRAELSKRGWTENDGAVVESYRAVIPFTTSDGPALLRLTHHDGRTIADLSLRKPRSFHQCITKTGTSAMQPLWVKPPKTHSRNRLWPYAPMTTNAACSLAAASSVSAARSGNV